MKALTHSMAHGTGLFPYPLKTLDFETLQNAAKKRSKSLFLWVKYHDWNLGTNELTHLSQALHEKQHWAEMG